MANEQAKQFIEQATQSIHAGQFGHGLELADQAIALDPALAEAHVIRGVGLSQLSRPQEASEAFRKAISLDPASSKAHFNMALHLYTLGDKESALHHATEAERTDAGNQAARDLASRIAGETGQQRPSPVDPRDMMADNQQPITSIPPSVQVGTAGYARGYEVPPTHTIPWIENLGSLWTNIGWGLAALSLAAIGWSIANMLPVMGDLFSNPEAWQAYSKQVPTLLTIMSWVANLGALLFTILDLVDRRGNFLWILSQVPCALCCGLGFITLPIYLLAGRK